MSQYDDINGYDPYGGYSYKPPKSFFQRVKDYFLCDKYIVLTAIFATVGLGLVLYQVFSGLYSLFLQAFPSVLDRYLNDYMFSTVLEMCYTFVCVGGAFAIAYLVMRKIGVCSTPLPYTAPYSCSDALLLVVAGTGVCFFGNLVTNFFVSAMSAVGVEFASYNYALTATQDIPKNAFELICMILHTAVFPAVFEEFAFRGVIMQPLRKYGDGFAILVSAVLFGLIHGNMTQMPFAIIAGIAIGYASTVTGSLWTGVVIHFFNNFLSLMNSFARETLSGGAVIVFSLIIVYGTMLVGGIALGLYIHSNPNFTKLRPGKYGKHKKSRLVAIATLVPSMTIALIWLIYNLSADVMMK